jgi:hypothetical protein
VFVIMEGGRGDMLVKFVLITFECGIFHWIYATAIPNGCCAMI